MDDFPIDEQGRPMAPAAGDEASTLVGFLEFHRATFGWKCSGLDAAGLATTVGPSTMTLGGMMKHLALVEDGWLTESFLGESLPAPWAEVDWDADRDWEWHTAADDSPDELTALWQTCVARSRGIIEAALADGGLESLARRPFATGERPSLRWILCHLIEEYARHNGHADLLREAADGQVGE